jgi:splicing factor 3B subunit 5
MNQQQLDALHAKYTGTGHADTNRYEFLTAHHRDTLSTCVANNSLLMYIATAEGESRERLRSRFLQKMVRPCGPAYEKDE